jgi:hypothetical protein
MNGRHIAALVLLGSVCAQAAWGQTRLTGMNLFGADASGRVASFYWTTDYTPTPHNWQPIYASLVSGGSFVFGPTNGNLGLTLAPGMNDFYFTADLIAFPHAFVGVNFFFENAVNPQFSFVRAMGSSTFSPIAAGTPTPSLLTNDGFTGSVASGAGAGASVAWPSAATGSCGAAPSSDVQATKRKREKAPPNSGSHDRRDL